MVHELLRFSGFKALALTAVFAAGCGGSSGPGPLTGEVEAQYAGPVTSTDTAGGALVYEAHCNGCHPGGERGFGPAVSGIGADPGHMRKQIREGSGRMPGFDEAQISSTELESLMAYLVSTGGVAGAAPTL